MKGRLLVSVLGLFGSTLAGCSGGNNAITCNFNSPATMSTSAWPKFRHDAQNTGTVTNTFVSTNTGQMRWMFPAAADGPKGPFAASPVLNGVATDPTSATRVYIGSTDGYVYAVEPANGTQDSTFYFVSVGGLPITSTALVTQRFGADALFFGGGDGNFYGVDDNGLDQPEIWPPPITGFLSVSPSISSVDGSIFIASLNGFIASACPNGVQRFVISTSSGIQSSPGIGADGTAYFGGDDRLVHAVRNDGVLLWTFSASSSILSAPVVAVANGTTTAIYAADRGGFVFKINSNGQAISGAGGFNFSGPNGGPVGPIQSSPALSIDPTDPTIPRLYVGSDDGNLYAINGNTGAVVWSFPTSGSIVSSPAVATGGAEPIIVVGSDDGNVYFVQDSGTTAAQMATFPVGAPVRSSPAIGSDGTIYVGADDGRLYAIQ